MRGNAKRLSLLVMGRLFHTALSDAGGVVEVVLVDTLNDPRGFCLAVVGSKHQAKPERGLQAQSCYSDQGQIAVDQAFDAALVRAGAFRLPGLQVCMTLPAAHEGAILALQKCDGSTEQRFDLTPAGEIVPKTEPRLCVTVGGSAGLPGGGGYPVHLRRPLTMEQCSPTRAAYQQWRVRDKAD